MEFLITASYLQSFIVLKEGTLDEIFSRKINIINSNQSLVLNSYCVDLKHFKVDQLPKKIVFFMLSKLVSDIGIREYVFAAWDIKNI